MGYVSHRIRNFLCQYMCIILQMRKFDIRKVRKLGPRERYGELYFFWREAEHMIASNFPDARKYGRRLKRRIESLHAEWFVSPQQTGYPMLPVVRWAEG